MVVPFRTTLFHGMSCAALGDISAFCVSGPKFVFYQPDAEPDVSAQLGRHALRAIPGAPSRTDSVFASKKAV